MFCFVNSINSATIMTVDIIVFKKIKNKKENSVSQIVIVEDEHLVAIYLKEILIENGFTVLDIIDNGKEAMNKIPKLKPDIVLMDIMLKDEISGSEVALHLKYNAPSIAIIFVTAYANDEMLKYAMESNSFGYIMKPYNEQEIINTLKIVLSRIAEYTGNQQRKIVSQDSIKLAENLYFDLQKKKLLKAEKEIKLSKNSIKLLDILCQNKNTTVSNEQIALYVWGTDTNDITVRTQIHRMKVKIEADIIHNVNGIGYMVESIE